MSEIKRYDLHDKGVDNFTMKEVPEGQYVRFDDHVDAIRREREGIEESYLALLGERDGYRIRLNQALNDLANARR